MGGKNGSNVNDSSDLMNSSMNNDDSISSNCSSNNSFSSALSNNNNNNNTNSQQQINSFNQSLGKTSSSTSFGHKISSLAAAAVVANSSNPYNHQLGK